MRAFDGAVRNGTPANGMALDQRASRNMPRSAGPALRAGPLLTGVEAYRGTKANSLCMAAAVVASLAASRDSTASRS
jgi:hypothetical protein